MKLDDLERRQLARAFDGAERLDEVAGSLELGPAGVDLTMLATCVTPDGAAEALAGAKALLARAQKDAYVALLGLAPIAAAVKVVSDGTEVCLTLHLEPTQYGDLAVRLAGVAAAAAQSLAPARQDNAPAPKPHSAVGGANKSKDASSEHKADGKSSSTHSTAP